MFGGPPLAVGYGAWLLLRRPTPDVRVGWLFALAQLLLVGLAIGALWAD